MQWLISQMWIALSAAGFLGLLLGFTLRGLFVGNKIRRARVERDVALTELEQSRSEVDALYAAQRKRQDESAQTAQAVSGDDSLKVELEQRETKIVELGSELMSARAELESLRASGASDVAEKAVAAVAGAAIGSAMSQDDAEALQARNEWLEDRVASLEAGAGAVIATEPVSGGISNEKVEWQNTYLRQRVDALQQVVAATPSTAPVEVAAAAPAEDGGEGDDEELARLRWRNRYLEGRLAYYEDDAEDGAAPNEGEAEPTLTLVETPEDAATEADAGEGEEHPADALLKELNEIEIDPVHPATIDAPDGNGDDLTTIDGIGPKISELLNREGIWSFAQIAEWTPENAAWVDQLLSFKGRVEREAWIQQAIALASGGGEAEA